MSDSRRTYQVARSQQKSVALASALKAERVQRAGQYFTLLLFGAFVILLLLGLWLGTVAFRSITATQATTDNARLALNSVHNRVRSFDALDAFSVGSGPEGPSMVFTHKLEAGNYENRLYLHEGALVQELAFDTDPYLPMTASTIVDTQTFAFSYDASAGLLTVTTDQGTVDVALRSGGAQ